MDGPAEGSTELLADLVVRVARMTERPPDCVTVSVTFDRNGGLRISLEVVLGKRVTARGTGGDVLEALAVLMASVERRVRRRPPARVPVPALAELESVPLSLRDAFLQATMSGEVGRMRALSGDKLQAYVKVRAREWCVSETALTELAMWLALRS